MEEGMLVQLASTDEDAAVGAAVGGAQNLPVCQYSCLKGRAVVQIRIVDLVIVECSSVEMLLAARSAHHSRRGSQCQA